MTVKKTGVVEWWNGRRDRVKEYWTHGVVRLTCNGTSQREAGGGGKRWVWKCNQVGKGGQVARQRTGFSHLFPDDSTQVVDFPHLSRFRFFWGSPEIVFATDETRVKHRSGK